MTISRRQFVAGCSTAIAAMAGGRLGQMVFAADPQAEGIYHNYLPTMQSPEQIFIMVFLRGGCDALSLLAPYDDPVYTQKRVNPQSSWDSLVLKSPIKIDPNNPDFNPTSSFGLHPSAAPLHELYKAGKMAFVHATGLNDDTRSHFDAMDYIERGTPGNKLTNSGWLARHIAAIGESSALLPTVSAGSAVPASLLSFNDTVAMNDLNSYGLNAPWAYHNKDNQSMLATLNTLYGSEGAFGEAGRRALEVVNTIQSLKNGGTKLDYTPDAGITYPNGGLSGSLKTLAQIIKLNLGLRIATVDFGGWDTHDNQGTNGGYFSGQVDTLSRALHAFYNDLPSHRDRLNIVVMSEFGRRLGMNGGGGTDHGHGGMMMVLGGKVNGGKIYGRWPGLLDLDQNQDLRITTDYRAVLGEMLAYRMGNTKLNTVFPGLKAASAGELGYQRLGIVSNSDIAVSLDT